MRVMMLNHEYPPLGGGAGMVTYNLAKCFSEYGHNVQVLTTRVGNVPEYQELYGVKVYRVRGCRSRQLDSRPVRNSCSYLLQGRSLGRKLIANQRSQVIHADMTIPAGLLAVELSRICGVPAIVVLHGSDVPGYNPDEFRARIKIMAPLLRWSWRRSSAVVAVSEGLKEMALKSYRHGKIHVIHNGVDSTRFCPPNAPRPHRGPLRILTVSRLVKRKGIQFLLEALALARGASLNFRLKVVGDGNYRGQLKSQANLAGLDEVEFLGTVSHEALPELYQWSEVFVLPSLTEAFGLAFAEAMACATPVVGTAVGGVSELVRDGVHGCLVQPGSSKVIFEALGKLLEKRDQLDKMGLMGRRRILADFTWQRAARRYLDIYRSALKMRNHGLLDEHRATIHSERPADIG